MKTPKDPFSLVRTKQINQFPTLKFSFTNKEDLRGVITDYVLHHIEQQGKGIPFRRFKSKFIKYPNINLKVNVNKEEREISIQFVNFLAKYIEIEKRNIYRQGTIEPLVVDILNFIDELEDKTKGIVFQIDPLCNVKKLEDEVLNLIIEKHHKDKQKKCFSLDIDEYRKKIIAKHARISYIDIEDQLKKKQKEFLLQISEIGALDIKFDCSPSQKMIIPNPTSNISDRLNSLIESGQIFQNPDKVHALKKQKLINFYKSSQVQYLNLQASFSEMHDFDNKNFSKQCSKMLKDWIVDISISEKYYQMKYGRGQKRKKALNLELDQKKLGNAFI